MNLPNYCVEFKQTVLPRFSSNMHPILLTDETMAERKQKVLQLMKKRNFDALIIYCDLEHGSNFEYLTGFLTRFEESLLVLHQDGSAYLLLGNENIKMANYSRIQADMIHVPYFSLPNQPMEDDEDWSVYFQKAGLQKDMNIGIAGWKMFTSKRKDNRKIFDVPFFIVDALKDLVGMDSLFNATELFINGNDGARITNNANEIAHYEYASQLASQCVSDAIDAIQLGKSELEIASYLNRHGQRNSVVTIFATGDRFHKANLYPLDKNIQLGDKLSITTGFKGGLSSRSCIAVENTTQLPEDIQDYVEKVAAPYYRAICTWLTVIHPEMKGKEMYQVIEEVLPKAQYHWSLNPGHLIGDEEWMSSPIYPESEERIQSGMLFQTDIIPSVPGYPGASCESGIAIVDEVLKQQIKMEYPEVYERFEARRKFALETLGIEVSEHVVFMNDTVAYYRPYALAKDRALTVRRIK